LKPQMHTDAHRRKRQEGLPQGNAESAEEILSSGDRGNRGEGKRERVEKPAGMA